MLNTSSIWNEKSPNTMVGKNISINVIENLGEILEQKSYRDYIQNSITLSG